MTTALRTVEQCKWLLASLALAIVAGCGGGGSDSACVDNPNRNPALPSCSSTPAPVATADSVQLLVSSQQLPSDGTSAVKLTVIAVDGNRQAVAGRPVEISVADPANAAVVSNFVQPANPTATANRVTDVNGQLTATLSAGSSRANRTLTLTATVDRTSATNTVSVTGTGITVRGSNTLALGATTQLAFTLADAAGAPIAGATMSVSSSAGNGVAPATMTTDSLGTASVTVTGARSGNDTITASALGATTAYALTVSSENFAFTNPPPGTVQPVQVGTQFPMAVRWTSGGAAVAGQPVNFATTRGTLSATQVLTDATGVARVNLTSPAPGPATVTASSNTGGAFATASFNFVANNVPARIDLQADRTTLAVNAPGTSANVATLVATVRDASDYPVTGARVNFHIDQDPTGGSLAAASSVTDAYGIAKTQYIPSALASPTNGVVISATALDRSGAQAAVSNALRLTVGGQRLFVRIGTDRYVEKIDANYTKKYSAFVTDAAGNPVPNATVQFLFRPAQEVAYDPAAWTLNQYFARDGNFSPPPGAPPTFDYAYFKGYWGMDGGQVITAGCFNEDYNFNGLADSGKDYNGNGKLDPGNIFSVNQSATTNASGYATGTITYPQAWALWIRVTLKVTAQVAGTEATDSVTFVPTYASGDNLPGVIDQAGTVPISLGIQSPFGKSKYCYERS